MKQQRLLIEVTSKRLQRLTILPQCKKSHISPFHLLLKAGQDVKTTPTSKLLVQFFNIYKQKSSIVRNLVIYLKANIAEVFYISSNTFI